MSGWGSMSAGEAVERLMQDHGGRIYGLGLRLCGDPEDARDLVQETFLRAYRKWDQFEGRSEPATWLYTIASRVARGGTGGGRGSPARSSPWRSSCRRASARW
jgi:RNA polymerase sigma-70 factor (ECF subfamily)